jgi:pyruvate, water dikinase
MRPTRLPPRTAAALLVSLATVSCGGGDAGAPPGAIDPEVQVKEGPCEIAEGASAPDFLRAIGCRRDFDALASQPLDASIPGARSVKFLVDTLDADSFYVQNSQKYQVHYEFASTHLSGNGKPLVGTLKKFNETEYYATTRRFILGSLTYYEGPRLWALEIAPYDTASPELIDRAFRKATAATFFGPALVFHPTSVAVERVAAQLPTTVRLRSTAEIYEKVDYQPLNLAVSIGRLRFTRAAALTTEYLGFRDIVVLDTVPNDLSVTLGIITEQFQTPLSHINVLSQTRKIPNMALRNAFSDTRLRALEGKWIRFAVAGTSFTVAETTQAEADAWWEEHKPRPVTIAPMDTSVTGLRDVKTALDAALPLRDRIRAAVTAFGGKATHFAAMAQEDLVPMPRPAGFIIPVYYYAQFLQQNGFDKKIDALLADPAFRGDPRVRDIKLADLRNEMLWAPADPAFEALLRDKLTAEYPHIPMRFRSSSTAEDLEGFAGAGLYTSKTGELDDPKRAPIQAIKKVWASVWFFRGYEERDYRSVDQKAVGMAVLAHPSFPTEEASGIAVTANPFDPSGLQPGFFINVQPGDESVTLPQAGVKADQFIYHYKIPGQPVVYLEHSSLVPAGRTVLTPGQVFDLGSALEKIHEFFRPAYGPTSTRPSEWYGLEVDFKFDGAPGEEPALFIKQARPHPGRGN